MQIVFLESSKESFQWFADYCENVFPEGKKKAYHTLSFILQTLKLMPEIGTIFEEVSAIRSFHVPQTPFSILYLIGKRDVKILSILDTRKKFSKVSNNFY
jgi:hypothetical protein